MPHVKSLLNVGVIVSLKLFFYSPFLFPQNQVHSEKRSLYLPLIDAKKKVESEVFETGSKNFVIQFIKYSQNIYLKVLFSQQKDTINTAPIEKFKTELEIQSGTKIYYKKEWSIFQENNQLFFVLLLPPNYLRTLSAEGITKVLIGHSTTLTLSKKETKEIKQIANYL
ncbi:MAG: hypothetical protein N2203_08860, partial [Bacteroidia bacterium]|nr:hypothetical protein [Bacteroidia bacterium]